MKQVRGVMGFDVALNVAQQPFGLVAGALDHLHTQALQGIRQRRVELLLAAVGARHERRQAA